MWCCDPGAECRVASGRAYQSWTPWSTLVPGNGHPAADGDVIRPELVVKHHGERLRVMTAG